MFALNDHVLRFLETEAEGGGHGSLSLSASQTGIGGPGVRQPPQPPNMPPGGPQALAGAGPGPGPGPHPYPPHPMGPRFVSLFQPRLLLEKCRTR